MCECVCHGLGRGRRGWRESQEPASPSRDSAGTACGTRRAVAGLEPAPAGAAWSVPQLCGRTSGNRRRCPRSSAMATDVPEVAFPLTSAILSLLNPHHCHGPSVGVVSRAVTTNPQALGWSNKKKKTVLIFKSFLSKKLDTSCLGTPCSRAATKGAVHGCHTVLCHCAYARTCSLLSCGVDRVRAGSPPAQTTPAMSLRWHWPPAVHTGTMAKGPAPHTDAALAVGCRRQQIPGEPGRGLLRPEAQVHLQVPSPEAQPAAEPGPGWGGGPAAELGPERPGLGRPSPGRPGPGWGGGPCR